MRDVPEGVESTDTSGGALAHAKGASLVDISASPRACGQGLLDEVGLQTEMRPLVSMRGRMWGIDEIKRPGSWHKHGQGGMQSAGQAQRSHNSGCAGRCGCICTQYRKKERCAISLVVRACRGIEWTIEGEGTHEDDGSTVV